MHAITGWQWQHEELTFQLNPTKSQSSKNFLEWSKGQGHNNFPTKVGVFKEHQDEPEDLRAIYEQAWVQ
jgi:hypothetical protein